MKKAVNIATMGVIEKEIRMLEEERNKEVDAQKKEKIQQEIEKRKKASILISTYKY